jgi:hypothetical protein
MTRTTRRSRGGHDNGTSRVRVFHEVQIGSRNLGGLTDASKRKTLLLLSIQLVTGGVGPGIPPRRPSQARGHRIDPKGRELDGERARQAVNRALDAGLQRPPRTWSCRGEAARQYDGAAAADRWCSMFDCGKCAQKRISKCARASVRSLSTSGPSGRSSPAVNTR